MSKSTANVKWAQRAKALYVTVEVVDATDVKVEFGDSSMQVTGCGVVKNSAEKQQFSVFLNLSESLAKSGHSFNVLGQSVQVHASKAQEGHWDKLTVESVRVLKNWLSCDWALWKDEDDEDDSDKLTFGGGGYGDLGNMIAAPSRDAKEVHTDDEGEERPPADLSDIGM
jgi:hypothetical protein